MVDGARAETRSCPQSPMEIRNGRTEQRGNGSWKPDPLALFCRIPEVSGVLGC
ncbi:hypothetical protein ES332_A11G371600v1 [Gossypium tomentosum]|uniref:Uncharacterized protein n=1 Tax=Gossypium tomentosum TaxID=34277 RepID=A0A5D2NIB3_GOSTO|nr:hypothetical protein ES332_A11G371600v1 [Gossypium tomentosum]